MQALRARVFILCHVDSGLRANFDEFVRLKRTTVDLRYLFIIWNFFRGYFKKAKVSEMYSTHMYLCRVRIHAGAPAPFPSLDLDLLQ